jgi:hypothetical protein
MVPSGWFVQALFAFATFLLLYILRINTLLRGVPCGVRKLTDKPGTKEESRRTYNILKKHLVDYTDKIPPRLDRRYVVTGGNGMLDDAEGLFGEWNQINALPCLGFCRVPSFFSLISLLMREM